MRIFGALGAFVTLVLLILFFTTTYTIDSTERGILLRNGAIVEVQQPGRHYKTPFIESIKTVDMMTKTYTYGAKGSMEAYSADQQPAYLLTSVTLHVSPDKVTDFYTRFGGDMDAAVAAIVTPNLMRETKTVFGQYTAASAITKRAKLNADASSAMTQALAYDPVFIIDGVQIQDISFSSDYIKSVEARMQAEVAVQRKQQELEQEKVAAQIAVTKAEGAAKSRLAEAEAHAKATKMQGDAEADAIKAKAAALGSNPSLVLLTQAEHWDGKLPTTMIPGGATPMLNLK